MPRAVAPKVAPCVEYCRPSVGPTQSSVECIVEVFVKVHLKGVTADISKFIHVDPVVSTHIFFRQKGCESGEQLEHLTSSTTVHGAEHLRGGVVTLSGDGAQQQTLATKRVTFCDFISTENVVHLDGSDTNFTNSLQHKEGDINSKSSGLKSALKEKLKKIIQKDEDVKKAAVEEKVNENKTANKASVINGNIKEQVSQKAGNDKRVKFGKESVPLAAKDSLALNENLVRKSTCSNFKNEQKVSSDPSGIPHDTGCGAKLASQFEGESLCVTPPFTEEAQTTEFTRKFSSEKTDVSSAHRNHDAKMTADSDQVSFTTPLRDYLSACGLDDLYGYLKVVGCLVVGDLLYLLPEELHALPLLPRRKLCDRLAGLKLTVSLPTKDDMLKHALKQQGLSHALGYVQALGALTLSDLSLLTEEDLSPLPPLTRRRLMIVSGRGIAKEKTINCSTDYLM